MRYFSFILLILFAAERGYSQNYSSAAYIAEDIKKKISGKICDTCSTAFTFNSVREFSYVITGANHTPSRFYGLKSNYSSPQRSKNASLHYISGEEFGITFLPNFILEKEKRVQLYRNFGGEDYSNLEFMAQKNNTLIKAWTRLQTVDKNEEYAVNGLIEHTTLPVSEPWKGAVYAGKFQIRVKDTLQVFVRNIKTKTIIQQITIVRPLDTATNFIYYQIPLKSESFSINLQNTINIGSNIKSVYGGDSLRVFEKDYSSIGMLRFMGVQADDVIQYSFGKSPYKWRSVTSHDPEYGMFIVLGNDMEPGKNHEIYLRYKSQPETIHKITIRVNAKPFQIPWREITGISALLLIAGGIAIYLWRRKNSEKLLLLKRKKDEAEAKMALLSGQLNPHFLFNSLNAIQGTITSNNPERANTYIGNVASFMRDVMDNGKKEFISLQEELKLEEDYLKLEQERIAFTYHIYRATELELSQIDFPPLLLQPVLENSIRHAFSKDFPNPTISISITKQNSDLRIEVADNGKTAWNTSGMIEGHGLSLSRKRLSVYNETLASMLIRLQINYQPERGTVTTFVFQNWLA